MSRFKPINQSRLHQEVSEVIFEPRHHEARVTCFPQGHRVTFS